MVWNEAQAWSQEQLYFVAPGLDEFNGPRVGDALCRFPIDLHYLVPHLPEHVKLGQLQVKPQNS